MIIFPQKNDDPLSTFGKWFEEAKKSELDEPTAMCLATADKKGRPSARMVLLKGFDDRGFVFFTNVKSHKGEELSENPYAALCFYWDPLQVQVRVTGKTKKITSKESDIYHNSRRRGSQVGAWASMQSHPLDSYDTLMKRVREFEKEFAGGPVPRPPFWGGFRIIPDEIEFWQHVECRLHNRILFRKSKKGWKSSLLYP